MRRCIAKYQPKQPKTDALQCRRRTKVFIFGIFRQKEKAALKRPKFREETNPQGEDSEKKTRITKIWYDYK